MTEREHVRDSLWESCPRGERSSQNNYIEVIESGFLTATKAGRET